MNQIMHNIMMMAAVAVSVSAAPAQEKPGSANTQAPGRPATVASLPNESSIYGLADGGHEAVAQASQPSQMLGHPVSAPKGPTTQASLEDLERRVGHHEIVSNRGLTAAQYVAFAAIVLIAGGLAYLWVRLVRLKRRCDRCEARQELSVDARLDRAAAPPATAYGGTSCTCTSPASRRARVPSLPRIQVLTSAFNHLASEINEFRCRCRNVETGYAIAGKIAGEGSTRVMTICGLINDGPNATRSGGHHKADRRHQQKELDLLQLMDGEVMYIGDAHLHPGTMDTCSGGDYRTDVHNVRASHSQEMIFVIATVNQTHSSGHSGNSVYRSGLKFDFYYMGRASDYEYRHVRPEVVQGEALSVPLELRRFAAVDPVRAKLDFDNLRRLAAYRMTMSELPAEGGRSCSCIAMAHKAGRFKTIITLPADANRPPQVFVDTGSELMQFKPSWLNGGWVPGVVWFAPIVLEVEREMIGRQRTVAGNDMTSDGGRSTPHEINIPGPTNGDCHGKLPATEQGEGRGDPAGNGQFPFRQ